VRAPRAVAGLPAAFWWVWAGTLLSWCSRLPVPFLAPYLAPALNWARHEVSLGIAMYGAGSILSVLLGGGLPDRAGRRTTIVAGLLCTSAATLLLLPAGRPAVAIPLLFVLGVLSNTAQPAISAVVADIVEPAERQRAYALNYVAVDLGFAVASVLATVLLLSGYPAGMAGQAVVAALAARWVRPAAATAASPAGPR
jgi:MFS family permease